MKVVMLEALEKRCKIKWVQNLKKCLEMFGWDGVSVEDLRVVVGEAVVTATQLIVAGK